MRTKNILSGFLVVFSIVPSVIVAFILVLFFNSRMTYLVQENIKNTAYTQASNIDAFFESTMDNLRNLKGFIRPETYLVDKKLAMLNPVAANGAVIAQSEKELYTAMVGWIGRQKNVNRVSIVNDNNMILVSSKKSIVGLQSQLEEKYIARLKQGESVITRIYQDLYENNVDCFIIAQPIIEKNAFKGFLMMSVRLSFISDNLQKLSFFDKGAIVVIDGENKVAAHNGYHDMSVPEYISLCAKITRNAEAQDSFRFKYMRETRVVCYSRLALSDWKVLSYIDPQLFNMSGLAILGIVLLVCAVFFMITLALRLIVVRIFTRPLEKLLSFMHEMNSGEYSTRIPYLGRNEFSEIATAFNNLMARIQADNRELSIKEERYRIANEQSNSIIFEFNVETGELACSPNACEFAAYPAFTVNFPDSFVDNEVVHEDDADAYLRLAQSMTRGRRHGAMEIRMKTYHGDYHWFALSLTTIADADTFKPLRVIGKMNDIDEEKRLTENLTFKAERDPLTSIYNKTATQTLITQRIAERKPDLYYAFIVLDIDAFKEVNDGYGHQKGDAVLIALANVLIAQIRGGDVVGRVGGDEFMMLLTEMPSKESIERKVQSLTEAIRKISLDEDAGVYISSSMGIAVCPTDGINFNQLYASADNALYARKNNGKDGFSFFGDSLNTP